MDRGTWWITVHGVTESDMTDASMHSNSLDVQLSDSHSDMSKSLQPHGL